MFFTISLLTSFFFQLKGALIAKDEEVQFVRQQLRGVRSELDSCQIDLSACQHENERLSASLGQARDRMDMIDREKSFVGQQLESSKIIFSNLDKSRSVLERDCAMLQSLKDELAERVQVLMTEKEALYSQLKRETEKTADLEQIILDLRFKVSCFLSSRLASPSLCQNAESSNAEAERHSTLELLTKKVQRLEQENTTLQAKNLQVFVTRCLRPCPSDSVLF